MGESRRLRVGTGDDWIPIGTGLSLIIEAEVSRTWGGASALMRQALIEGRVRAAYADLGAPNLVPEREISLAHWRDNAPFAATWIIGTTQPDGAIDAELVVIELSDFKDWLAERSPNATESAAHTVSRDVESMQASGEIYSTGLPGRPSSWSLIEDEFKRRWTAGERHKVTGDDGRELAREWASVLRSWLNSEHPKAAKPTEKTIRNKLGPILRKLT